jgi:eukaryotic-like serine/threonine-protein kinase
MNVSRELWRRVRPLFDELADADAQQRVARLAELEASDPEAWQALDTLLRADEGAEAALRDYSFGVPPLVHDARDPLGIIGASVAHFDVMEFHAAGGMGVVYRARDRRLSRVVALKFPLPHEQLDPAAKERFLQEARSAAALDHPNLCTIHEVGESAHGLFLAMPLYPGETLRQRLEREHALPADAALDIVRQVATGLLSAHAAGIVHRDLKSGNIMLLPDGSVRILDFGLAKVRDVGLTRSHAVHGTIAYMAPEQIRGEEVDARADLWSTGVLLYEMLTGVLPFHGGHDIAVLHRVLYDEPRRASELNARVPHALDVMLERLLQKDPAQRYASAEALLADVSAVRHGAAPARSPQGATAWAGAMRARLRRAPLAVAVLLAVIAVPLLSRSAMQRLRASAAVDAPVVQSLVVLPFANASGDASSDYLVAGFTNELASLLGAAPGVRVPAVSSAATLQRQELEPRAIGERLGVAHIVAGRAQLAADTFRVAVRLTRVGGALLWSRDFSAPSADVLDLQREVADSVLRVLLPRLPPLDSRVPLPTTGPEAYDLYLKARFAWTERRRDQLQEALAYYRGALDRDPEFALAHAGMAEAYLNMGNFGYMPVSVSLARAEVAARRAVELAPTLAETHTALGFAQTSRGGYSEAEASLVRAIELRPGSPWAYHYYALLLIMTGRIEEAKGQTANTLAADPLSLPGNATLGIEFAAEGNLPQAQAQLRQALELSPNFPLTLHYLGAVEAALGNHAEARQLLERALAEAPAFPGVRAALAHTYTETGSPAQARRLLEDVRSSVDDERSRVTYALALAVLGEPDSAFAMLRTATWDVPTLIELRANPLLQAFRADPRYPLLLAHFGLRP